VRAPSLLLPAKNYELSRSLVARLNVTKFPYTTATQVIFYYGQTAPMWKLHYSAHVDVWANATSFEARTAFYTLGLDRDLHYSIDQDQTVRTFTYGFAINELWVAAGLPGSK